MPVSLGVVLYVPGLLPLGQGWTMQVQLQRTKVSGYPFTCGKHSVFWKTKKYSLEPCFSSVNGQGSYPGILWNEDSDFIGLGWARAFALRLVRTPYFESQESHQEFKHMPAPTATFKWYFVKFPPFLHPVSLPKEQRRRATLQDLHWGM